MQADLRERLNKTLNSNYFVGVAVGVFVALVASIPGLHVNILEPAFEVYASDLTNICGFLCGEFTMKGFMIVLFVCVILGLIASYLGSKLGSIQKIDGRLFTIILFMVLFSAFLFVSYLLASIGFSVPVDVGCIGVRISDESYEPGSWGDSCLYELAIKHQDPEFCQRAHQEMLCLKELVRITGNARYCDALPNWEKDQCLRGLRRF